MLTQVGIAIRNRLNHPQMFSLRRVLHLVGRHPPLLVLANVDQVLEVVAVLSGSQACASVQRVDRDQATNRRLPRA